MILDFGHCYSRRVPACEIPHLTAVCENLAFEINFIRPEAQLHWDKGPISSGPRSRIWGAQPKGQALPFQLWIPFPSSIALALVPVANGLVHRRIKYLDDQDNMRLAYTVELATFSSAERRLPAIAQPSHTHHATHHAAPAPSHHATHHATHHARPHPHPPCTPTPTMPPL
eukprot:365956-Chlamydomonas_euryale.AAC.6